MQVVMVHVGAHRALVSLMSVGLSQWCGASVLPKLWAVLLSATGELFLGIATALGHGPPLYKALVARPLRGNLYELQN